MRPAPRLSTTTTVRKRIVVVTETHRCRYYFLRCMLRELNQQQQQPQQEFGLMKTLVDGVAIGGVTLLSPAAAATSAASTSTMIGVNPDVEKILAETAATSSGVDLVSLLSVDATVNFEVCFVDAGNSAGSSSSSSSSIAGVACLETLLCDVDTRACVLCFEGPDPSFGASSEKAVANQLVSTADSILGLWHKNSSSPNQKQLNVSGSLKLLVAICSASSGAPATVINISGGSSSAPRTRQVGEDDDFAGFSSSTTPTSPPAQFSSSTFGASSSSKSSAFLLHLSAWFNYLFQWTRLLLSVLLFGISQKVVSWTDKVTSVREGVQHISNRCREVAGEYQQARTSVHFSGLCSLSLVVAAASSAGGKKQQFELLGDGDFARFVKSLA